MKVVKCKPDVVLDHAETFAGAVERGVEDAEDGAVCIHLVQCLLAAAPGRACGELNRADCRAPLK
jgi:hypothetical protein